MKIFPTILTVFVIVSILIQTPDTFGFQESHLYSGKKWSYISEVDQKICVFDTYQVRPRKNQKGWSIKGRCIAKMAPSRDIIDTYTTIENYTLSEDFKLLDFQFVQKRNGKIHQCDRIQYKQNHYELTRKLLSLDHVINKQFSAANPLCFFDAEVPWSLELLLQNNLLNPTTGAQVITTEGIETIEIAPLKETGLAEKVYSLNKDTHIHVEPDGEISQISIGNNFVISQTRQQRSETIIQGLSLEPVVSQDIFWIGANRINYLHVKIKDEVNYLGDAKNLATLDSPRQTFKGTATNERSDGEVFITALPNPPGNLISFPVQKAWPANLSKYLSEEALVESDHPQIIAKAKEITATSKTLGAAVREIATWVYRNVQVQESTGESALETLHSRKGVCRHHARLAIALCRSVNIPARLIIGLAYSWPSFGYHAWIEVYFGTKDGWVAIDPTWGQIEFVDATHIGLTNTAKNERFISEGGTKIEVLDYQPITVNPVVNEHWVNVSKLWKSYQRFDYNFLDHGKVTGVYHAKLGRNFKRQLVLKERLYIPDKLLTRMNSSLTMSNKGQAIRYQSKGILQNNKFAFDLVYNDQKILAYDKQRSRKSIIRITKNESQADLFGFFQWGLVLNRLTDNVIEPSEKRLTIYTPDQGYINLDVAIKPVKIDFLGTKVAGMECEITSYSYKRNVLITKEGIVTRIEMPDIHVAAVLVKAI